jgi:hypothetical protein
LGKPSFFCKKHTEESKAERSLSIPFSSNKKNQKTALAVMITDVETG